MLAFSAWVAKHVPWPSPAIFKGWISSLLVYSFMCWKKEIKEEKKKSLWGNMHPLEALVRSGELQIICFAVWNQNAKVLKTQNITETFELKVKKDANRKEASPLKSFRLLSCSCKFPDNSQRHMLFSYEGVRSFPGHSRITSWDSGLCFK